MSRLEDLLQEAGDGTVHFDHRDIARRVKVRRQGKLAALAAVVVLGLASVVAVAGEDDQVVDSVGQVDDGGAGAVAVPELVGDRWVATAYSAVIVAPGTAFLEFGAGGELVGFDGCSPITGGWRLAGTTLVTSLEAPVDVPCVEQTGDLFGLLERDPTVSRFDGVPGTLQLRSGEDFIAFERFDRLGDPPTTESVSGTWTADGTSDASVTFAPDGTGRLDIFECSASFDWSLADDVLEVDGLGRPGIACDGGVVGGGLLMQITARPRVRVDGSFLWVSSQLGVFALSPSGPDTGSSTTSPTATEAALGEAAQGLRFVTASPDGVAVHEGDAPNRVVGEAAAIAFAVGPDTVVYQPASADAAVFPPSRGGAPRSWVSGEERPLPVADDARRVRLLDAALLDGQPVALIAETYGGVGPDDTFEELVIVDLHSGTRSTVVRRPSWHSGHMHGRVLPGGDVIGLMSAESLVILARWSVTSDEPLWTVEVGSDTGPTLTLRDGQVSVVATGFDDDLEPVLDVAGYRLDGEELAEEYLEVMDPSGALGAGLHCTDWRSSSHLLCGRSDGPPILLSMDSSAFVELPGAAGAFPTIIRRG